METSREFIAKTQDLLDAHQWPDEARAAYLAAALKRHTGVQREFARLVKDDPRFDIDMRAFLPRAYNLKAIADYETGPGAQVSAERAREAIEAACRFVECVAGLIPANGRTPRPPETEPKL